MAKQRYTAEQVIEACKDSAGIKAIVAKKLGCDRATVCRYAKRYKTVRDALRQADETATDLAEAAALKRIQAEYWPAIKYRLDTKGKNRGYARRTEVTGAEGGAVELALMDRLKRVVEMSEDEFTDFAGTIPDLGPHGTLEEIAEVEG